MYISRFLQSSLPASYKKLVVEKLSSDFRAATKLVEVPLSEKLSNPANVLVKNHYVGINASDINFTSGKYYPGKKPPFPVGFEGVGEVVVSSGKHKIGQPVAYLYDGSFSEYHEIPASRVFPVPDIKPEYVGLLVSGLTAKLALDKLGDLSSSQKQTVLVTAAAGGTGHLFAQLAKIANPKNAIIGTTSNPSKADFLSQYVDHAIDLSAFPADSKEFAQELSRLSVTGGGLDLVYESVGRELFDAAFQKINVKGRMIIIGYIGGYKDGGRQALNISKYGPMIPVKLLMNSASLRGFFLFHYARDWSKCFTELVDLTESGELKVHVDTGFGANSTPDKFKFNGIEDIADAVDYLYTRQSVGKIVAKL